MPRVARAVSSPVRISRVPAPEATPDPAASAAPYASGTCASPSARPITAPGPSRAARSTSRIRSSDLAAAPARCAANSVSQETRPRPTETAASSASGVVRAPTLSSCWNAPTTTSAISIAWPTTRPAPASPSTTTAIRKPRVARA